MAPARLVTALLAAALAAGCIIVPTPPIPVDGISDAQIATLKPGLTTRADVLMAFGDPTLRVENDRYFSYDWSEVHYVGAVGGAPQAYPFDISDTHRLAIEFAADGRIVRLQRFARMKKKDVEKEFDAWLKGHPPS